MAGRRSPFAALIAILSTAAITALLLNRPTNVVNISAYPVDDRPVTAAQVPADSLVVRGTVQGHGAARVLNPRSAMPLAYTPVRLLVDEVLAGDEQVGKVVVVRGLGGRVGDTTYVFDEGVTIDDLPVGMSVVMFLGRQRDSGDGELARTPYLAYVVDTKGVARSVQSEVSIPLADFRLLISEAAAAD